MTWFRDLSKTGKGLSVIGAVFVAGVMTAAWFGLPAQVRLNRQDIGELQATMTDILCILTQPEGANPLDCVQPPGE